jgi:prepilin-type N-terminal cleavage/methylation domain-containing protein
VRRAARHAPARAASRDHRGFTLLEVMVTLAVLSFGLVTLAYMQLYAMRQGSQGRHTNDAAAIARSFLEQAVRLPWSELDATVTAATWVAPGWDGAPSPNVTVAMPHGGGTATERAYAVTWRVTNVGTPPTCLRDVEVRVTWNEEESSADKSTVIGTRRYNRGAVGC